MNIATLRGGASTRVLVIALSTPLAVAAPLSCAYAGGALPASGAYVSGSGTIAKAGKSGLTIDQSSATGIIDWNSFSIGRKNSVTFDNGSGATLNRVTGGNLSTIAGSLKATGSLYLINPQGMIVSGTGRVLTGGNFVGSSRDLSDDDFAHGKRRFTGTSKGAVVNQGTIRSSNGDVALIGSSASNSGILSASHGSASLDAGDNILLAPAGSNSHILVSGGRGNVTNSGTIAAAQAQLDAAGGNVYALSGNNGGIVRATGTSTIGGHVWLTSNSGNVSISGTVAATNANGSGGTIEATGANLSVGATAKIDASGTRGGTILLGGDIHGGRIAADNFVKDKLATAQTTTIAKGATITADASHGAGGNIVVWSDRHTSFAGSISATGAKGSQGGFSEVSSHDLLGFTGKVDLTAWHGKTGTLLLDPENVVIESGTTTGGALDGGSPTNTFTPSADDSVLSVADLEAALASANVTVTTGSTGSQAGDITVLSPITWSANTLTLDAYRNINIEAAVSATGSAGLTLIDADTTDTGVNDGNAADGDLSFSNGGNITFASTGEALSINGHAYVLVDSISDLATDIAGDASGHYALANSYDASADGTYSTSPITTTFTGTFDGLGNKIENLSIDDTSGTSNSHIGLFAQIGDGSGSGKVRHLKLTNVTIAADGDYDDIGGLVGYLYDGTISGVAVSGTVTATSSSSSSYTELGGLVGRMASGTISNVTVSGIDVAADGGSDDAGGLAGSATGTISGVTVSGAVTETGDNYPSAGGVIGYAYALDIENSASSASVTGGNYAGYLGGFVGASYLSTFNNDSASGATNAGNSVNTEGGFAGDLQQSTTQASYASGAVSAGNGANLIGGFAGYVDGGTVETSYATGAVSATSGSEDFGGFVGLVDTGSTVETSYATGTVSGEGYALGGFAGDNRAVITQSYSVGQVTGGNYAGGFIGDNQSTGTVDESYSTGAVSGGATVGGFAGLNENTAGLSASVGNYYNSTANTGAGVGSDADTSGSDVHGLALSAMHTVSSFSGWTFGTTGGASGWVIVDLDGSLNNTSSTPTGGTTPLLLSEYSTTITNAHQLQLMALDLGANYTLANNIDASGTAGGDVWSSNGFVPIGTNNGNSGDAYTGTFDGQNHVISGLFIGSGPSGTHPELSWVGLFGYLGGTVENVGLSDANITGNNGEGALIGVGALAGASYGTITNAWSSGTVTASQKDGQNTNAGGLVGYMDTGTISGSYSSATVSDPGTSASVGGFVGFNLGGGTIEDSYATGNVTGGDNDDVGGFIGFAYGGVSISDSYAKGAVTEGTSGWAGGFVGLALQGTSITDSFATGNVSGAGDGVYGGFVGSTGGSITDSYADGNVSKSSTTTGGDFGGFAGGLDGTGTITQSYSTGSVTADSTATLGGFIGSNGGAINQSYSKAIVTGGKAGFTGGFAGENAMAGTIGATTEDYYDTDGNGSLAGIGSNPGGGTVNIGGLTTIEMQSMSSFAGWSADFGTTGGGAGWVIVDQDGSLNNASSAAGGTTPMLLSEYSTTITNAHQLQLMALDPTASYTLANDIDASGTGSDGDVWGTQGFIAVGGNNASADFSGTFDGAGHTISGLMIADDSSAGDEHIGLFGSTGLESVMEDVSITGASISAGKGDWAGILAGYNQGTITGVSVSGTVAGQSSATSVHLGGLVGEAGGTISSSSASATVTVSAPSTNSLSIIGGLVGVSSANITDSYASGEVSGTDRTYAGGLIGQVAVGSVEDSYATGAVSAGEDSDVGGFVGWVTIGSIDESYSLGAATGGASSNIGGFAGHGGAFGGTTADYYDKDDNSEGDSGVTFENGGGGLTRVDMENTSSFSGWTFGGLGSGADWVIVDRGDLLNLASGATGATTPILVSEYSTTISNAHQLELMQLDTTASYTLARDIDASGTAGGDVWGSDGFVPVGDFSGSFNGGGHTISGLTIDDSGLFFAGLFNVVDDGATVSDVMLANVNIAATGNVSVGALAGASSGTISNVIVSGSVSGSGADTDVGGVVGVMQGGAISNAHSSATVIASADDSGQGAGGLVGFNSSGTITQSSATGDVSMSGDDVAAGGLVGVNSGTISQSFASGTVTLTDSATTSGNDAGGLVGVNDDGAISQSYATGSVTLSGGAASFGGGLVGAKENGGTIDQSYSLGTVSATTAGGLVGSDDQTGSITNSYWDTKTSGIGSTRGAGNQTNASGITGETTSSLQSALPSGFDSAIWKIVGGTSFPYLAWQFTGTPEVLSGTVLSGYDGTGVSGATVNAVANGAALSSALTAGGATSFADGSYYFLLAPGTLATNGSASVIVYRTGAGGAAYEDNLSNGSATGLSLYGDYLHLVTSASNYTTVLSPGLSSAIGTDSALQTIVDDLPNLAIDATGLATGSFAIDAPVDVTGNVVITAQNGTTISQSAAITASGLLLEGSGAFTLSDTSNAFATLAGDLTVASISDGHALTVGTVAGVSGLTASGAVGLVTSGALSIDNALNVGANTLTLTAGGAISDDSAGIITASTLTGSSSGGTNLGNASNLIGTLGAFTNSGAGGVALTDGETLTASGVVNAGTGNLTLKTTGTGHNLWITNALTTAGTATLTSSGTIAESGSGKMTAASLTGTSVGGAALNGANLIATLSTFTNTGAGGLALTDGETLTASGVVNAGTGNLTLKTTGTGHNLSITNALTTTVTASLTSAGTIAESGSGKITAATLTGSSVGGATLNGANLIATLSTFTNTGAGGLALTDGESLTASGAVNAGTGALSLKTTGTGHKLSITNALTTTGTASLISASTIAESGAGKITAATLTGSSVGAATLTSAANKITDLGAFTTGGNFAFALTDAHALTVDGAVNTGTGALTLTTSGTGDGLVIDSTLHGGTVKLASAAAISSNSAGRITATTLTGSSKGAVALDAANVITDLGAFTTGGNYAFALTDVHDLTVDGAVNAGTGALTLTTTGTGNDIIIDSTLHGGTVKLASAGTISSNSAGKITATTLTGSSKGAVTLNAANVITDLGAFTTGNGAFALTDAASLTTTGTVNAGTGTIALTTTGSGHNIAVDSHLTTSGSAGVVTLTSAGKVTETSAGAIVTHKLNVKAATGITLTSPSNNVTTLGTDTTTSGPNSIHL